MLSPSWPVTGVALRWVFSSWYIRSPAVTLALESYKHNADDYQLTRASMEWYWNHYLKDQADATNPYAAPLAAKDLSGLPPALVITAEYDPLRDEGEAYARRLQEAGVRAHHTCYDGMIHGFFGMPAVMDKGRQAIAQASAALKGAFAA